MNYIERINHFWELDETWQFTCCETRLYFYLLKTANRLGWVDSWTHSDAKTAANVGVSVNSLKSSRNRLVQAELISFQKGGKGQGDRCRYQLRCQNLIPKPPPKLTPKPPPKRQPKPDDTLLDEININQTPPLPPDGGMAEGDWKKDFQIYLNGLRTAYEKLITDPAFLEQQQKYHPGVNIPLTIEKACVNFWATEAGWKNKKSKKINEINWKSTLTNAISQPQNKVYHERNYTTNKANTTDERRKDLEQLMYDSAAVLSYVTGQNGT
jgi:hypothetical protein